MFHMKVVHAHFSCAHFSSNLGKRWLLTSLEPIEMSSSLTRLLFEWSGKKWTWLVAKALFLRAKFCLNAQLSNFFDASNMMLLQISYTRILTFLNLCGLRLNLENLQKSSSYIVWGKFLRIYWILFRVITFWRLSLEYMTDSYFLFGGYNGF